MLLTGLQVWAALADHFSIGQLLATVPLWEINLRSKVAVSWKALFLLYMTALPVRYLSHTPASESPLKNESKCIFALQVSRFIAIWLAMLHMAIWHPNEPKISNFLRPQRGLM